MTNIATFARTVPLLLIAYLGVINYLIMKRKLKKFQKIEKPIKTSDE